MLLTLLAQTAYKGIMKLLLTRTLHFSRSAEARSAVGYLAANVLAALVPLALLPILTRVMTPEAYGQYSLFLMVVSLSMPLVTLMLASVTAREYLLREKEGFARLFTNAIVLQGASFTFLTLLCLLFGDLVTTAMNIPPQAVILGMVFASAQGLLLIMQGVCTMQKRPSAYISWRVGFALSYGLAAYLAATHSEGNWQVLVRSQAGVALVAITLILSIAARRGWLTATFKRSDTKLLLAYSLPLVFHSLTANVIVQNADRFFISHYLGLAEVGSYNAAQQISLAMYVVINSIGQAWNPWYYEQMKDGSHTAHRRIVHFTYMGFGALAVLGAAAAAVLWLAYPYVVGEAFQSGREIFPWLVLGFVFNGMYVLISSGMFYTGHTVALMLCNLVTATINIALNVWLVPLYGMHGAAAATVLSTFCMLLLVWSTTARLHRLPWLLRKATLSQTEPPIHG
jgi:O-antigen/teichoic acid export membrane protein